MANKKWELSGEFMESCNCDYLCPCIYTNSHGPVTHDHCTAIQVYRIDDGHYGDTRLDGLKFALVIRSGKVMADGNWIFAGVVDATANDAQRKALDRHRQRRGRRPAVDDPRQSGERLPRRRVPTDRVQHGRPRPLDLDRRISCRSPSRASPRPARQAARSTSTTPSTPRTRAWRSPRRRSSTFDGFGLNVDLVGKGNNGHFAPFSWAA